jgi:competence protein ComEC
MHAAYLGFVVAIALQLQQVQLFSWWIYAAFTVCFGLLAGVLSARAAIKLIVRPLRTALWALAFAALGFGMVGLRAMWFDAQRLDATLEGQDIEVQGMVSHMPQPGLDGVRFRFDVDEARLAGQRVQLPRTLSLGWYGGPAKDAARSIDAEPDAYTLSRQPQPLRAGERWRMTVRLKAPHGNMNPHGFDYELWLWEQGVGATGYVRATPKDPAPQRLAATWQHPVEQVRQQVREAIFSRVPPSGSDARTAGILAALTMGDQAAIDRADWDVFRATGVAHLMSISGLHITLFAWIAAALLGWLWRRSALWGWRLCLAVPAPSAAALGGLLFAVAYAVFSGWGVPAQRTVWMLAVVVVLRLWGLRWPWYSTWLLVMCVVLAVDPWAMLSAGFWLSFIAVGVLFASDQRDKLVVNDATEIIATSAENTMATGRFVIKIWQSMMQLLREQTVVSLALAPLTLLLFGQISLVGFVANLLAIPWVTLVVTPLALLGVVLPWLWVGAAWALQLLALWLQWLAALPWATYSVAAAPPWLAALSVAGALLMVLRVHWGARALGAALVLPALLWQAPRPAVGQFELLAADVGQGNAVVVRTASHSLVYDAGPRFSRESDAGQRTLVPLLRALGERIDTLVLSHRDIDHVGGAVAVLQMQPQAKLLSSIEATHELQNLRRATRCEAGQQWLWDGVRFEVLHPQAADYDNRQLKPNALSCVLRISNGVQTALLAGDIEAPQELRLVNEQSAALKADVLLVPHHGSKTSSGLAFLQAVQPREAWVQAGYRNRFGHPASLVAQRYADANISLIDTPRCGAIRWQSDAVSSSHSTCQRDLQRRYWHHKFE